MNAHPLDPRLLVVVGAGGVGKTTLAAALGVASADAGARTLVMTFDPSGRLKDALGEGSGRLRASMLDARETFDALVRRYAPDPASARRILENRFYDHLSGNLAGVLEYMAVERLFEVANDGNFDRVILDTPPTRQALDFLEAPDRIVGFLDSGALRVALRPWFSPGGTLRPGPVRRRVAGLLDRLVGLDLLREMAEFFQAFAPLYDGFRHRSREVQALLRRPETRFLLVAGPGESRVPDVLFFARRLRQAGHHLAGIVVNQVHGRTADRQNARTTASAFPAVLPSCRPAVVGGELLAWLGDRDARGLVALRQLVTDGTPVAAVPLLPESPTGLAALAELGGMVRERMGPPPRPVRRRPWRRSARA